MAKEEHDTPNISIRDLMESMRQEFHENTKENASLRIDVHALKEANILLTHAVEGLTVAIRGGNGPEKGLIRHMDFMQESQKIVADKILQFEQKGTPASQMELRSLREKDLTQDVSITEIKGRLEKMEDRSESRRWQLIILFVGSSISIIIGLAGLLAHFFMPKG